MDGLHFDVGINTQPFERGIKNVQHQAQTFDQTMKQVGRTIMGVFGAVSVGYVMRQASRAFAIQEKATMQLSIATRMAGDSTGALMDDIVGLGDHLQRMTGIGNEATEMLAAMGLNMGVAGGQIVDATRAASLMSLVFGIDAQTAMRGFAQTLEGTSGMLGRYLPELRNMTEEQLRSGEAIELVIQRLGPYEDAMRNTAEVATRRFWEALGDVGKVLGGVFVPGIQSAADWMESFAANIEKPGDILEAIKHTVVDFWEALGPLGKTLITVIGAFVAVKTAGLAWSLLTSAVITGSKLMIGIFHTLVSWPVLLVAGVYALRVAWEHNWFGIRDTLESFGIYVENWKDNALEAFGDVADSWKNLLQARDVEEVFKGVVDLAVDILRIPAKIVFGPEHANEFGERLLNLLGSLAFVRIIGGGPVLAIAAAIASLGISEQFKRDIQQAESLLDIISIAISSIYTGAQTLGAGFTEAFGGDTQRYMDATNKHLDSIRANIQAISDATGITDKIEIGFELTKDVYNIPAKLILSGFIEDEDQTWLTNLTNILAVAGIARLVTGKWTIGIGIALLADVVLGSGVSGDDLVDSLYKISLGAFGAAFLAKSVAGWSSAAKIGIGAALVIGAFEVEKTVGGELGHALRNIILSAGIAAGLAVVGVAPVITFGVALAIMSSSQLERKMREFSDLISDWLVGGEEGELLTGEMKRQMYEYEETLSGAVSESELLTDELRKQVEELLKIQGLTEQIDFTGGIGGGSITRPVMRARGGFVSGPGSSTSDSIPAWLSDGEFVVNAAATKRWLPVLEAINAQRFAAGGYVTHVDAGPSAGGDPLGTFSRMFSEFAASFTGDLGKLFDFVSDLFGKFTDIDTSGLDDLKKTISELEGLERPELTEWEHQTMEAGERLSRMINVIELTSDGLSSLEKEIKIFETILGHFEDQIDAVTKLYVDGEISLGEFTEQLDSLTYQANWTSNALKELQGSIQTTSELLDGFNDMQQKLASGSELLEFNMESMSLGFLSVEGMLLSFGMSMLEAAMNVEAINMLLNPLTTIVRGFFEIAGPILNILKPLGDALASFGRWMAIGLVYMQPLFKAFALIGATISWAMDQVVLMVDNIFVWLSGLPIIGDAFDPILSEDQRRHLGRGIQERIDETTPDQHSTIGTTFQAGSTQEIHNYYYFEFKDNHILTEDDRSVRHFSDLIYNNLRDRGVIELEVG